jgi:PAS domain-containing protein
LPSAWGSGYARGVQRWDTRQKDLLLILARDVASKLATPMFVVDHQGTLVFFNEAAEAVLGQTFSDAGEMRADEWSTVFQPVDPEGTPLPLDDLPLGIALQQSRASHRQFRIRGADGVERDLAVTALPLLAHTNDIVGAVALFWPEEPQRDGA